MIDPQSAEMTHVGSQGCDKRSVGLIPQGERVHRRKSPVLADRIERIGRCAGWDADGEEGGVRPGLGTCPVDTHGEVAVERSEEHTSELQSLMRISYAVFCLK